MDEFLFYEPGRYRNKAELLHDILIVARDGLKPTRLMNGVCMSWSPMQRLVKVAKDAGFIEEVEIPRKRKASGRPSTSGLKTTAKGLKYAQAVYETHILLQGDE